MQVDHGPLPRPRDDARRQEYLTVLPFSLSFLAAAVTLPSQIFRLLAFSINSSAFTLCHIPYFEHARDRRAVASSILHRPQSTSSRHVDMFSQNMPGNFCELVISSSQPLPPHALDDAGRQLASAKAESMHR